VTGQGKANPTIAFLALIDGREDPFLLDPIFRVLSLTFLRFLSHDFFELSFIHNGDKRFSRLALSSCGRRPNSTALALPGPVLFLFNFTVLCGYEDGFLDSSLSDFHAPT
jgi:hypothetical protein